MRRRAAHPRGALTRIPADPTPLVAPRAMAAPGAVSGVEPAVSGTNLNWAHQVRASKAGGTNVPVVLLNVPGLIAIARPMPRAMPCSTSVLKRPGVLPSGSLPASTGSCATHSRAGRSQCPWPLAVTALSPSPWTIRKWITARSMSPSISGSSSILSGPFTSISPLAGSVSLSSNCPRIAPPPWSEN